jgi:predicted nucleotidyltransferase
MGNLSRKLIEMENNHILTSEVEGRQKYYRLNKNYPLLEEVKKLYQSEFSLPTILTNSLTGLPGLKEAYIFGSYAKGTMDPESDIDIILIGEHDTLTAKKIVLSLQKRIGREINIIDFSEKEYQEKMANGNDFLKNIFSGKIIKVI